MRCAHCIMSSHSMCRGGDCTCTDPRDGIIGSAIESVAAVIAEYPTKDEKPPPPPEPPKPKRQPRDPWICVCIGSTIDGWGECQTCRRPWIEGHSPPRPEGGNAPLTEA